MAPFILDDIAPPQVSIGEEDMSSETQVEDVADMVDGYLECMEEAMRYLVEVERYPDGHPAVEALRQHLASSRRQLIQAALVQTGQQKIE